MPEIRNIRPRDNGSFDCEINHPDYGWIPFTASPDDVEPHGRAIWGHINQTRTSAATKGA